MGINIFQVDVFSDKAFAGNPAGVVPSARGLSPESMQLIAREMNMSETAFVEKVDSDLFEVRFFTPLEEVDLCGHATIGAFFIMAKKHYVEPIDDGIKKVEQITKAGRLPIFIEYRDGEVIKVFMNQKKPESFGKLDDIKSLARSLNISEDLIGIESRNIMPEIVSTGLKDILIPVKSKEALDSIEVNKDMVTKISRENDVIGYHVYYKPEGKDVVYTRNFAPLVGIDEESATGTSNGALTYLLYREGLLSGNDLLAYQGESMNRMSQIICSIDGDVVRVGGRAKMAMDGILMIS